MLVVPRRDIAIIGASLDFMKAEMSRIREMMETAGIESLLITEKPDQYTDHQDEQIRHAHDVTAAIKFADEQPNPAVQEWFKGEIEHLFPGMDCDVEPMTRNMPHLALLSRQNGGRAAAEAQRFVDNALGLAAVER